MRVIRNMAKILNVSTETLINGTSDDNQDVQSNLTIDVSAGETIQIAVRGRSGEEENYKMKRYKDGISSQKTVKDKKTKICIISSHKSMKGHKSPFFVCFFRHLWSYL